METQSAALLQSHKVSFEIVLCLGALWAQSNDVLLENIADESINDRVLRATGLSQEQIDIIREEESAETLAEMLAEVKATGYLVLAATPSPDRENGVVFENQTFSHGPEARWSMTDGEWFFGETLEEIVPKAVAWKETLCGNAYVIQNDLDEIVECALCDKKVWMRDTWSPADDAICAECDTEVSGREHPPSLDPARDPSPGLQELRGDAWKPKPPENK